MRKKNDFTILCILIVMCICVSATVFAMGTPPDISGATSLAMGLALKSGNVEVILIVTLVTAILGVVWYYWKKNSDKR